MTQSLIALTALLTLPALASTNRFFLATATVSPAAANPSWIGLPLAIAAGDVLSIAFSAEPVTEAEHSGGQAGMVLKVLPSANANSGAGVVFQHILLVGESTESFRLAFRSPRAFAPGEATLLASSAVFRRPMTLSHIRVTNHGPDAKPEALQTGVTSYPGQAPDAPWRAEAARRIDRYRKAELAVRVTDRLGRALSNATVEVTQVRHAYPFGSAVVATRLIDAPVEPVSGTRADWLADNQRYRAELKRLFNCAVFENDLKWPQWAGERPARNRQEWTLAAADWLCREGFDVKGHTLVWASWERSPGWLRAHESESETLQAAILAHIRDIGSATAGWTRWWDVLNEPMSHRDLITLLGTARVAEWFKEARRVLPGTRLVLKDFDLIGNGGSPKRRADIIALHRELVEHGAPVDVLGLQSHFWSDRLTPPETMWQIMDELHAATGLPLMVSEFDMNLPNEAVQAEYTRDFLTAWFAHPASEALLMWGFWGGAHWYQDAGAMFRRDWSEKPNLKAYTDLVLGEWWTRTNATTQADGIAPVRVLQGRHRVTIRLPEHQTIVREVEVPASGATLPGVLH
jgi:GH35 family endo-1,4-beta-xylanase